MNKGCFWSLLQLELALELGLLFLCIRNINQQEDVHFHHPQSLYVIVYMIRLLKEWSAQEMYLPKLLEAAQIMRLMVVRNLQFDDGVIDFLVCRDLLLQSYFERVEDVNMLVFSVQL